MIQNVKPIGRRRSFTSRTLFLCLSGPCIYRSWPPQEWHVHAVLSIHVLVSSRLCIDWSGLILQRAHHRRDCARCSTPVDTGYSIPAATTWELNPSATSFGHEDAPTCIRNRHYFVLYLTLPSTLGSTWGNQLAPCVGIGDIATTGQTQVQCRMQRQASHAPPAPSMLLPTDTVNRANNVQG